MTEKHNKEWAQFVMSHSHTSSALREIVRCVTNILIIFACSVYSVD